MTEQWSGGGFGADAPDSTSLILGAGVGTQIVEIVTPEHTMVPANVCVYASHETIKP